MNGGPWASDDEGSVATSAAGVQGGKVTVTPCQSATGGTNPAPPMVDTVAVCVPVGAEMAAILAAKTGRRVGINSGGDIEWDHPRIGSLPGSFDPNLWVQIYEGKERVLRVEGSAHRHILGHNVTGGPTDTLLCARYMIDVCERWLGVPLPHWSEWRLQRLDLAWVFDAGSEDAAYRFMRETATAWQTTTAARSAPRSFGTTVYVGPVKLYMKGPELVKHPPQWATEAERNRLLGEAVSKVRFEVTYRRRDIERLTLSRLDALDQLPLVEHARQKLARFGRTSGESMKTVRTIETVTARLGEHYSPARASALMGTWFKLTTLGEQSTKSGMPARTYFRHVSELRAAGVSWSGTDVMRLQVRDLPEDFTLSAWSPYIVRGQAPEVARVLAAYAA